MAGLFRFGGLFALLSLVTARRLAIEKSILQTHEATEASNVIAKLEETGGPIPPHITVALLKEKLPADQAGLARRRQLFTQADGNGNGILSLAEIDKLVRTELGIGDIGPTFIAPVLMRAYQVARNYKKGADMTTMTGMKAALALDKANLQEATVDRREFRVLLVYLQKYLALYQAFQKIDTNFDGRIEPQEFQDAQKENIVDSNVSFEEIDADGGGMVLFDEFAAFFIARAGLNFEAE